MGSSLPPELIIKRGENERRKVYDGGREGKGIA